MSLVIIVILVIKQSIAVVKRLFTSACVHDNVRIALHKLVLTDFKYTSQPVKISLTSKPRIILNCNNYCRGSDQYEAVHL